MTNTEVACPKCGGRTWDNRATKKNPKAPDYKCRDKSCDGAVWPPKNGAPAPAHNPPSFTSPGAPAGFLADQEQDEQSFVHSVTTPIVTATDKLQGLVHLYTACLDNAVHLAKTRGLPPETVAAMAATLFIAGKDRGLAA